MIIHIAPAYLRACCCDVVQGALFGGIEAEMRRNQAVCIFGFWGFGYALRMRKDTWICCVIAEKEIKVEMRRGYSEC